MNEGYPAKDGKEEPCVGFNVVSVVPRILEAREAHDSDEDNDLDHAYPPKASNRSESIQAQVAIFVLCSIFRE